MNEERGISTAFGEEVKIIEVMKTVEVIEEVEVVKEDKVIKYIDLKSRKCASRQMS